jgi:hypothetical protein
MAVRTAQPSFIWLLPSTLPGRGIISQIAVPDKAVPDKAAPEEQAHMRLFSPVTAINTSRNNQLV